MKEIFLNENTINTLNQYKKETLKRKNYDFVTYPLIFPLISPLLAHESNYKKDEDLYSAIRNFEQEALRLYQADPYTNIDKAIKDYEIAYKAYEGKLKQHFAKKFTGAIVIANYLLFKIVLPQFGYSFATALSLIELYKNLDKQYNLGLEKSRSSLSKELISYYIAKCFEETSFEILSIQDQVHIVIFITGEEENNTRFISYLRDYNYQLRNVIANQIISITITDPKTLAVLNNPEEEDTSIFSKIHLAIKRLFYNEMNKLKILPSQEIINLKGEEELIDDWAKFYDHTKATKIKETLALNPADSSYKELLELIDKLYADIAQITLPDITTLTKTLASLQSLTT